MGLFDIFKKKKTESQDNENEKKIENKVPDNKEIKEKDPRFFLVIDKIYKTDNEFINAVVGVVHGRINLKDEVYIYMPDGEIIVSTVRLIDICTDNSLTKQVDFAENEPVSIWLVIKASLIKEFSVISNIKPYSLIDSNNDTQNPVVAGLLYEVSHFKKNNDFFSFLIFSVVHAHFIFPVWVEQTYRTDLYGTVFIEQNDCVKYKLLPNPKIDDVPVLPVFTDKIELSKWLSTENLDNKKTVVLDFPDVVELIERDNCSGFVINPFSVNRTYVSKKIIRTIINSAGYKKEFCNDYNERR